MLKTMTIAAAATLMIAGSTGGALSGPRVDGDLVQIAVAKNAVNAAIGDEAIAAQGVNMLCDLRARGDVTQIAVAYNAVNFAKGDKAVSLQAANIADDIGCLER